MKLEKAIAEVLKRHTVADLLDCIDEIKKLCEIRRSDGYIMDAIEEYLLSSGKTDIVINYETDEIIYREQLFANMRFRISLTPQEISNKNLVIGHRFLPYIHPSTHPKTVFLIDEADNEIEIIEEQRSFLNDHIYFSLLPPYGLQHYDLDKEGNLTVFVYDLSEWMKRNKFTSKDNLLISPIDYEKNIFRIEKLSSREINSQKILNKRLDELFGAALMEHILDNDVILPIDLQLFNAFAIADKSILEQVFPPIGPFVSNHEILEIFNNGMYSYMNTKENMEVTFDMAMDEAMYPDLDAMGKATDIPGIFSEMGISYTQEFIEAKMIEQIHLQNNVDKDELYRFIFRNGAASFFNDAQKKNFETAFDDLSQKVEKKYAKNRLPLAEQQLLTHTLKLKVDLIGLLREIDARVQNPERFDFSLLIQLQPFENLTDGLLDLLIDPKEARTTALVRDLTKQVKQMRTEFAKAREFILDQIN